MQLILPFTIVGSAWKCAFRTSVGFCCSIRICSYFFGSRSIYKRQPRFATDESVIHAIHSNRWEGRGLAAASSSLVVIAATHSRGENIVCLNPAVRNAETIAALIEPVEDSLVDGLPVFLACKFCRHREVREGCPLPISPQIVDTC